MNGRRRRHPKMDNPSQFVVCLPRRTSSPLRTEVLDSSFFASMDGGGGGGRRERERERERHTQILHIWRPMAVRARVCPSVNLWLCGSVLRAAVMPAQSASARPSDGSDSVISHASPARSRSPLPSFFDSWQCGSQSVPHVASKALGIQSKLALCRQLSRLASTGFVSLSKQPLDGA